MKGCLNPTDAWICGTVCTKDGVVSPNMVFSATEAMRYFGAMGCLHLMENNRVSVPCGKCYACMVKKRKDLSTRLAHEASMYENSCFITLTYNDEHVPTTDYKKLDDPTKEFSRGNGSMPALSLLPRDVQLFMKRLRRHLEYRPKRSRTVDYLGHTIARDNCKVRYFCCGEYGSKTHRPHYHIIIFGWRPSDAKVLKFYKGRPVYTSEQISNCWTMRDSDGVKRELGFISFCDVSPFVAKYVAQYVTKKLARVDSVSFDTVVPEFRLQSVRNGGIGAPWFDRFGAQQLPRGFVDYRAGDCVIKASVPPYYYSRLRKKNLPLWLQLRDQRIDFAKSHRCLSASSISRYEELTAFVECEKDKARHFANQELF